MIDYEKERSKYRPKNIKTLLIGEAPPPNGKVFFYVPKVISRARTIENDTSLPSTIFNHYFRLRPINLLEYQEYLKILMNNEIFLIDIIDEPIRIRGNKVNEAYLISKIPELRNKIQNMGIKTKENDWIFLLARSSYKSIIHQNYPHAQKIRWKDFRLNSNAIPLNYK